MRLTEVAPLPGRDLSAVLLNLTNIWTTLHNMTGDTAPDLLANYQAWCGSSSETLGYSFSLENVERLVMTRRHWTLMGFDSSSDERLIRFTVSAERQDRLRALDVLLKSWGALQSRWEPATAKVIIADSNVYLHADRSFKNLDWLKLADARQVRLLVPMQVVRELDSAKHASGGKRVGGADTESVRDRARRTLGQLRDMFEDPDHIYPVASGVEMELLLDPVGHPRLGDGDSEIIERALAAQTLTGRPVSIVTDDGGMQFSAASAGLTTAPMSSG